MPERIITVFGSSRSWENDADYDEARALGAHLAKAGLAVCSGGYGGVMEWLIDDDYDTNGPSMPLMSAVAPYIAP